MIIENARIIINDRNIIHPPVQIVDKEFIITIEPTVGDETQIHSIRVQFKFKEKPIEFRDYDYTWQPCDKLRISNPISPKVLKFREGLCIIANRYIGTWVYDPQEPMILEWRIWVSEISPTFHYDDNRLRHWYKPNYFTQFQDKIKLSLIQTHHPIEISRSKIPFSAVLCFTDHCDFDSEMSLKKQRDFFKSRNIKVTKSFFTKHFSHKGGWNASLENNLKEYIKWVDDGHELAYHSLSQSILESKKEEENLFATFSSPYFTSVNTWIDHGYQPYNWALQKSSIDKKTFQNHASSKGINLIWNYFDVSEVSWNLNQNNYQLSDPYKILLSNLSILDKIRVIIFYNGTDDLVAEYRRIAPLVKRGKFIRAISLLKKMKFNLNLDEYVKRVQVFFLVDSIDVSFFQSIVVKDWALAFAKPLDKFVEEKGVAILHTYFSFRGTHHHNPLFKFDGNDFNRNAINAFDKLSILIRSGHIWNPTVSEFHEHIKIIQGIQFNSDTFQSSSQESSHLWKMKLIRTIH